MKFNSFNKLSQSARLTTYVIITIFLTAVTYGVLTSHKVRFLMMTQQEQLEDTSAVADHSSVEDSIETITEKIDGSTFGAEYSADSWMKKYQANRITFNDQYNKKSIDIYGKIAKISTSLTQKSIVSLEIENDYFTTIQCTDIKGDKDMWRSDVKSLIVGQQVHIRGVYEVSLFDEDNLHIFRCHIIGR